jgi:multidrug efflux system membrane fusion protein
MRRKIVIPAAVLIILAAGGGGFAFTRGLASNKPTALAASPLVPIVAGVVDQHDVPIYLTGVGTVIAYNTDIVRSQIQGQIVSIDFAEGRAVHTGDMLAQIDPRGRIRLRSSSIPRTAIAIRLNS